MLEMLVCWCTNLLLLLEKLYSLWGKAVIFSFKSITDKTFIVFLIRKCNLLIYLSAMSRCTDDFLSSGKWFCMPRDLTQLIRMGVRPHCPFICQLCSLACGVYQYTLLHHKACLRFETTIEVIWSSGLLTWLSGYQVINTKNQWLSLRMWLVQHSWLCI